MLYVTHAYFVQGHINGYSNFM